MQYCESFSTVRLIGGGEGGGYIGKSTQHFLLTPILVTHKMSM